MIVYTHGKELEGAQRDSARQLNFCTEERRKWCEKRMSEKDEFNKPFCFPTCHEVEIICPPRS